MVMTHQKHERDDSCAVFELGKLDAVLETSITADSTTHDQE